MARLGLSAFLEPFFTEDFLAMGLGADFVGEASFLGVDDLVVVFLAAALFETGALFEPGATVETI